MFKKVKQFFHNLKIKDHADCSPRTCEVAAKLCNELDNAWRVVALIANDGPCCNYTVPNHEASCIRCTEYELACAIMNDEKPITDWIEMDKASS